MRFDSSAFQRFGLIWLIVTGCVALSACTTTTYAADINIKKWNLQVDANRPGDRVFMYMPIDETDESASLIEVPRGINPDGLSSLVLVKRKEGRAIFLVGGVLEHPENSLILLHFKVQNNDSNSASFRIGDITLERPDRQAFPYVGISKDDSPLIGKLSDKARESSGRVRVTVESGKATTFNYCFALLPGSFPLRLRFKEIQTEYSVANLDALGIQEATKKDGLHAWILGSITVTKEFHVEPLEASVGSSGTIARFVAERSFSKGDELPGYVNSSLAEARTLEQLEMSERLDGKELKQSFPLLSIVGGKGYYGGRIFILNTISPMELKSSLGMVGLKFTSQFHAEKGDVLGGVVNTNDVISVLSARWVE